MQTRLRNLSSFIEVLAGDLWESAVNAHPYGLACLNKNSPGSRSLKDEEGNGAMVKLNLLSIQRFDIANKMGTILRDKFNFDRLESVRDAYFRAFSDQRVRNAIQDKSLKALSLVRNLIVHKGGIVDEHFLGEVKGVSPALASLQKERRLPIDGVFVNEYVVPAIASVVELIRAVDDWICRHPQKAAFDEKCDAISDS